MSNFTTSGATHRACLTDTVPRKIIVMEVMFGRLRTKPVYNLLVADRSKCRYREHLCLTTREEPGSMCPRQNTNLTAHRTHLVQRAPIGTYFFVRDHMTHNTLFNFVENLQNLFCLLRIFDNEVFHRLHLDCCNIGIPPKFIIVARGGI